ncbi:MAG: Gfo/Idh/MocA family oxidoreductase [Planctomycetes bacterium]|nr:Gfo/Idh/MocA family oxidoreductase [Planctomycetota bacterium]
MDDIRWGIIGCGDVTEIKSGPALQKAEGSCLAAVMRRNGKLAADYARRHNVEKWYDDADKLIADPDVDAIYVATPPSSHKEYTIAAAKAGKPVYVEKPMALNYDECKEMILACETYNTPLFVAYYRRALPRFVKIKSLLDEGAIGKVRFANVIYYQKPSQGDLERAENWRVDPKVAGGGYFHDLAPHSINILQFFLSEPRSAKGYSSNQNRLYEADDIVSGIFITEDDIHVSCTWNFNAYENFDNTEIVGDSGKITFSTFADNPIVLENDHGRHQFHIEHPQHIQQPLIQTIVDQLHGIGQCPSKGPSAAKTSWIMENICTNI